VAVVGATTTPGTVPHDILENMVKSGFTGRLYAVAPGKKSICGVPAYRYVLDLPEPVDLAVIVFPAEVVERALDQCGQRGIPGVVVISAGFREIGAEGRQREKRLVELCEKYQITLIGPNCLGVLNTNPAISLNASFARAMPATGKIAMLSQSGALCTAVLDYARERHVGFSKFVSFGNKALISEVELLEYLHKDPQTSVILMYLEEMGRGRQLCEVARRITSGPNAKPIFAIKSARTRAGAQAASSHTGAMATEDALCEAAFAASGIIRVDTLEELFDAAILFANQPLPRGRRVGIVTNAGGPGVLATDAAVRFGLKVPPLQPETRAALKPRLPATANLTNPVDVIGDARADRYEAAMEVVLQDPNIDQLLVILTPQSMTDIEAVAEAVSKTAAKSEKPVAASFMGGVDVGPAVALLESRGVPHFTQPEDAARAMLRVAQCVEWRAESAAEPEDLPRPAPASAAQPILDAAIPGLLPEDQALQVLAGYGLPIPPFRLCRSAEEAVAAAEELGYPAVLRVVSPAIIHKTEVGGVVVNIQNPDDLRRHFDEMMGRFSTLVPQEELRGILVRRMIPPGHELIIGGKSDESFGPVLMMGLGGIFVEVFGLVAFALAPVTRKTARKLLEESKAGKILSGLRGQKPADIDQLVDAIVRVGQLLADFPQISELDINPLIVGPADQGSWVADARIVLRFNSGEGSRNC